MRRNERLPGSWLGEKKTVTTNTQPIRCQYKSAIQRRSWLEKKRRRERVIDDDTSSESYPLQRAPTAFRPRRATQPPPAPAAVSPDDDRRRHDPKSSLVVDTVRPMLYGRPAKAGLDSFAMCQCVAPPSLIIDEWGICRDDLAPPPQLSSVNGTPLKILGVWRNAEFELGEEKGLFRCDVTVGEMGISHVEMLLGIEFMAATKAVVDCGKGYAVLTSLNGKEVVFGKRYPHLRRFPTELSCGCVQQLYLADKLVRRARRQQRAKRSAMAAAQTLFSMSGSGTPLEGEPDFSSDREFAMYLDSLM